MYPVWLVISRTELWSLAFHLSPSPVALDPTNVTHSSMIELQLCVTLDHPFCCTLSSLSPTETGETHLEYLALQLEPAASPLPCWLGTSTMPLFLPGLFKAKDLNGS